MFKFKPYITVIGENGLTVDFELSQLSTFMANNIDIDNGLVGVTKFILKLRRLIYRFSNAEVLVLSYLLTLLHRLFFILIEQKANL